MPLPSQSIAPGGSWMPIPQQLTGNYARNQAQPSPLRMPTLPQRSIGGNIGRFPQSAAASGSVQLPEGPTNVSTSEQTSTSTQQANRSPNLDAAIAAQQGQVEGLRGQLGDAYSGYGQSFNDMMSYLQDAYRMQGSGASQAAGQSALASGLSPSEATALAAQQYQGAMRQMYPQLAQLQQQQSMVPIQQLQAAMGLEQSLGLPMLSNVIAPYEQGVAGTTGTQTSQGTQTQEDILGRASLQAQLDQQAQMQSQMPGAGGISPWGMGGATRPSPFGGILGQSAGVLPAGAMGGATGSRFGGTSGVTEAQAMRNAPSLGAPSAGAGTGLDFDVDSIVDDILSGYGI